MLTLQCTEMFKHKLTQPRYHTLSSQSCGTNWQNKGSVMCFSVCYDYVLPTSSTNVRSKNDEKSTLVDKLGNQRTFILLVAVCQLYVVFLRCRSARSLTTVLYICWHRHVRATNHIIFCLWMGNLIPNNSISVQVVPFHSFHSILFIYVLRLF